MLSISLSAYFSSAELAKHAPKNVFLFMFLSFNLLLVCLLKSEHKGTGVGV